MNAANRSVEAGAALQSVDRDPTPKRKGRRLMHQPMPFFRSKRWRAEQFMFYCIFPPQFPQCLLGFWERSRGRSPGGRRPLPKQRCRRRLKPPARKKMAGGHFPAIFLKDGDQIEIDGIMRGHAAPGAAPGPSRLPHCGATRRAPAPSRPCAPVV